MKRHFVSLLHWPVREITEVEQGKKRDDQGSLKRKTMSQLKGETGEGVVMKKEECSAWRKKKTESTINPEGHGYNVGL